MVVGLNTKFTSCLQLELYAVYVDHTATNRPFKTIEDMVDHAKLYAANPHTEFSHFGCTF
jgi:selenocysteine lyase/cysteine desulfurase